MNKAVYRGMHFLNKFNNLFGTGRSVVLAPNLCSEDLQGPKQTVRKKFLCLVYICIPFEVNGSIKLKFAYDLSLIKFNQYGRNEHINLLNRLLLYKPVSTNMAIVKKKKIGKLLKIALAKKNIRDELLWYLLMRL